jgi:hypothetical protein
VIPLQPIVIGAVLALGVSAYAAWIGLDVDRAFYPTVVCVVASYYVLFSVMGGSTGSTILEISIASIFIAAASLGFRRNLWLVVMALAAHGILDAFHGSLVLNPGVPSWWPAFCGTYDLTAAAILALILRRAPAMSKVRAENRPTP